MTEQQVIHLATQALILGAKLAAPILLSSLVVGVVVSLFQSVTQIQDYTFTFVPKLLAVAVVLIVAGPWMLAQMVTFTHTLFSEIPHLLSGG